MNINIESIRRAGAILSETVDTIDYLSLLKLTDECMDFNRSITRLLPTVSILTLDWALSLKAGGQLTVEEISALWTLTSLCEKISVLDEESLTTDEFELIVNLLEPLAFQVSVTGITPV